MDRIKSKINSCGVDGIEENEVIEMKYWACIADAMTSYDYHYKITEEMEKPENQYGENYDENGRFYTPMRNSRGRYMSRGGRRGYEQYEPDWDNMEYMRDMDKDEGHMYYTDANMSGGSYNRSYSGNGNSRYDRAKRGYEESKANHPNDTDNNMKAIETLFDIIDGDMQELKPKMSQSEKTMAKNKLMSLANTL